MKTFATAVIALNLTLAAYAGPSVADTPEAKEAAFKKLDTNGDGSVSLEEFKASPEGVKDSAKAEAHFKKLDTNGDGTLSLDEFKAQ